MYGDVRIEGLRRFEVRGFCLAASQTSGFRDWVLQRLGLTV